MTFFISSISAEVCRGKKKQICGFVIASEVWGVCSINGWDGLDEQEKSCLDFFLRWYLTECLGSDSDSEQRRPPCVSGCRAARAHQVSSEEKTYRWTMSRFDPERLVILTSCFKKKQAPQTLEEPPEDLSQTFLWRRQNIFPLLHHQIKPIKSVKDVLFRLQSG